jgi:hypothetical protein
MDLNIESRRMGSMRFLLTCAAAVAAISLIGVQPGLAFQYENQGTSNPTSTAPRANFGGVDMNPSSVLPPMGVGVSVEGSKYDLGPGAANNGMAQQPGRNDSIGPSWLYPPR